MSFTVTLVYDSVVCACSVMSDSLGPPWTIAHQTPLFIEFSRQEYWSGFPFPTPGDLPDPEIELGSLVLQTDSLSLSHELVPISELGLKL